MATTATTTDGDGDGDGDDDDDNSIIIIKNSTISTYDRHLCKTACESCI